VVAVSVVLALAVNATRSTGDIPLVAEKEYEILVPCPEHVGKSAQPLAAEAVAREPDKGVLLVDARDEEAYQGWHLPGAVSIPYDYLTPDPREQEILNTHARKVVVYGDGDNPDSGEELANAISSKGVRNVYYVRGGAPALRERAEEGGQ
jgi:rhodanese-related sulfurtransferase